MAAVLSGVDMITSLQTDMLAQPKGDSVGLLVPSKGMQLADLADEQMQYVLIDDEIFLHAAMQRKLHTYAIRWCRVSVLKSTAASPPDAATCLCLINAPRRQRG
ncbi:hypothetical protein DFH08DRAFT_813913 [Mycena albidolilacea]|uniref:Uncharacterized protein n=1 Tax=Mycena albidolilacea TaxID=1033008 RepID=A0AAD6ZR25_9AGAR|nr:hypothetical protein DFH08DRAFT_813913 [Mycena albidolilacea]